VAQCVWGIKADSRVELLKDVKYQFPQLEDETKGEKADSNLAFQCLLPSCANFSDAQVYILRFVAYLIVYVFASQGSVMGYDLRDMAALPYGYPGRSTG
jgi:hypothetical protein